MLHFVVDLIEMGHGSRERAGSLCFMCALAVMGTEFKQLPATVGNLGSIRWRRVNGTKENIPDSMKILSRTHLNGVSLIRHTTDQTF